MRKSKLGSRAVTSGKLANGAVKTRNLSRKATLAMAGVIVVRGEVRGWFNRFSDQQPTVEQPQPGVYDLRIPGELVGVEFHRGIDPEIYSSHNLVSSASLLGVSAPQAGEISTGWTQFSNGSDLHPIIYTFDSAGNPADRSFTYLVYYADHKLL